MDEPRKIIETSEVTPEQRQKLAQQHRESQRARAEKLDIPMEVLKLQDLARNQKQENNRIKSQIGSLAAQVKDQQKLLQKQQEKLESLENSQKEALERMERICATVDELLAKERPEASRETQDASQRFLL